MFEISRQTQFKKDFKSVKRQGKNINLLKDVIEMLAEGKKLPGKYKNHLLVGNYANTRECHIKPDWLLIYRVDEDSLYLIRTGSHSELFN